MWNHYSTGVDKMQLGYSFKMGRDMSEMRLCICFHYKCILTILKFKVTLEKIISE